MMSTGLLNKVFGVGLYLFGKHRAELNVERMAFVNFKFIGVILIVGGVLISLAGMV